MKLVGRCLFLLVIVCASFFMWLTLDHTSQDPAPSTPPTKQQEEQNKGADGKEQQSQLVHIKRSDGSNIDVPLEEYLVGVVGSEMSASFEAEALKAQAVAARTFAAQRGFQVDDTTSSQVYQSDEQLKTVWGSHYDEYHKKLEDAVAATKRQVMTYQGTYITAAFFSSSNGKTNNSEDYWKNATPYLRSVDSPWDVKVEGNVQECAMTRKELSDTLGFQQPIQSIQTPERYANGYVKAVNMDGIVFTGRELREQLGLRSSAFEIKIDQDTITFVTHGFGHGIGMSQYGANAMAKEGKDWKTILNHYYTDIEISELPK